MESGNSQTIRAEKPKLAPACEVIVPAENGSSGKAPAGLAGRIVSRYTGHTVLAVGAHPDDVELALGGTIARLSAGGVRVVMVVVCVPNELKTRLREVSRSAEILGAELRVLVADRTCRVEDLKTYELVEKLDALNREFRPAAVFTHGPVEFHNDHVLVHNACLSSQRLGAMDFFYFAPTSCRPIPVDFHPQAYVDISDTIDVKMRALEVYASQFAGRCLPLEFIRDMNKSLGHKIGARYAEGLEVVRLKLA